MLDKKSVELLQLLNKLCADGGYKILKISELKNSLVKVYKSKDDLVESLKVLYDRDYISIKYQDDEEVCVNVLTKGRLLFENTSDINKQNNSIKRVSFVYSFFFFLFGGVITAVIVELIKAWWN